MAISPVNVSRITHNLRTDLVVQSLRQNQRDVFLSQAQIASGRSFVAPSEDPVAASRALDLTQARARQQQFVKNTQYGDNLLSAADSALGEISSLLIEASSIAIQNVGSLTSAEERDAVAELIAGIRNQLMIVGNRQFNGRNIFGGRSTVEQPFVDALGGVAYVGDSGELLTRISEGLLSPISVTGSQLFGALSPPIESRVDLTPVLSETARLEDINGANGDAIQNGTLVFNEIGGAGVFSVDVRGADSIGDVAMRINAAAQAANSGISASVTDTGITIDTGGSQITVTDTGTGSIAASLGILTTVPTSADIVGAPLIARITRLTPIESLAAGSGIDLENGILITNGGRSASVDFSTATTVQDVLNAINNAGVFALARINDAGTGIEILNEVSGTRLSIGENGGAAATNLGIRTLDTTTPLADLNFGVGVVQLDNQADLRITAKDGQLVDVDLSTAATVGDVLTLINEAASDAGVDVEATLVDTGNGIRIEDGTGGTGELSVSRVDLSPSADDLGLRQTVTGTVVELVGDDVNPVRTDGFLGALIDLENALRSDDTKGISDAGSRLDGLRQEVIRVHGIVGARAQAITAKHAQMQDAALTTEVFLSQVRDLDYAEAVTKLQGTMTQLQANLQASSRALSLSLLDFLA